MHVDLDGKKFLHSGYKTIALQQWKYKIDQKYFQLGARKFNIVSWLCHGFEQQEIPPEALYHQ